MKSLKFGAGEHRAGWLCLLVIIVGTGLLLASESSAGRGWSMVFAARAQDDASYDEEVANGLEFLRRNRYEEALKSFKRANQMREKKSAESFLGMARAYQGLDAYKNVIESTDRVIEFAGGDNKLGAQAYNLKGLALQAQAELKNQKKLQEAEAALRQGLALAAGLTVIHYNLGFVLLQQNRDPEGIAEMKKYLELESKGIFSETARKMIENPRRAREPYAPDFSFTTADGEFIELEDLRGKVVVLDFWGVWCPPCRESVPSLRNLHKRFSKDPAFVMIGVDVRDDEETWRAFIAENKMAWRHVRDEDHEVVRAFRVNSYPTYLVIDHEGIMRFRTTGMSMERAAGLEDAIKKQLKLVSKTATPD